MRCHESADLEFPDGVTALIGPNGSGKTSIIEAIGLLALGRSFRGAPTEAVIRRSAEHGYIRGQVRHGPRSIQLDMELSLRGRNRVLVNGQRLRRNVDLSESLQVTIFSPADLELIQGGPALRRGFLDELLVALSVRHAEVINRYERALKQRNALLKQVGGRLDADAEMTLTVWTRQLVEEGEQLVRARENLVERLNPLANECSAQLAGAESDLLLTYERSWGAGPLDEAFERSRAEELRRGITVVGPHRDDMHVELAGLPARVGASQGEQRTLALALRLAGHDLRVVERDLHPLVLLDDVLSELDDERAARLLGSLPRAQVLLSTAATPPAGLRPDLVVSLPLHVPWDASAVDTHHAVTSTGPADEVTDHETG